MWYMMQWCCLLVTKYFSKLAVQNRNDLQSTNSKQELWNVTPSVVVTQKQRLPPYSNCHCDMQQYGLNVPCCCHSTTLTV